MKEEEHLLIGASILIQLTLIGVAFYAIWQAILYGGDVVFGIFLGIIVIALFAIFPYWLVFKFIPSLVNK